MILKSMFLKSNVDTDIGDLPPECLDHIFSYLNFKDLLHCSEVSQGWNDIVKSHSRWVHADFRQIQTFKEDCLQKVAYKKYADFMKGTDVQVKKVTFDANLSTPDFLSHGNFDNLLSFLNAGNCTNVKHFSLKWAGKWEDMDNEDFECAHLLSLTTLILLTSYCPRLDQLQTQFNWTADSLQYLVPLKNLQVLEIACIPPVHGIQKWHLNKLLQALPFLKTFKLQATLLPHHALMQKYTFCSESLKTLDLSECINFSILELSLPNLEWFIGREINGYLQQKCIFDMLTQECPALIKLNSVHSTKPGFQNFGLNEVVKRHLRICSCQDHNMRK